MKIRIDKEFGGEAAKLAAFLCKLVPDRIDEITEIMKKFNDYGLCFEVNPLKSDRKRSQENYYRKWVAGFAKHCGLTREEMHEEILMITFGEEVVDTLFGPKRRSLKRSQETSKETYADLIDTLIRTSAEMGYDVPASMAYKNALQLAQEKWGIAHNEKV